MSGFQVLAQYREEVVKNRDKARKDAYRSSLPVCQEIE
jgi:hypothetical protein